MNKGFSGATVEIFDDYVVKRGRNAALQSVLCSFAPLDKVCPRILSVPSVESVSGEEFYCMERLDEPSSVDIRNAPIMFDIARDLLAKHVWSVRWEGRTSEWERLLIDKFYRVMTRDISMLTRLLWLDQAAWHNTHGDPTLSNMLYRQDNMVIIDPLRANYVAPHWTVDIGKMLQSAIGWEQALAGWYYSPRSCIEVLLDGMDELSRRRAWFWCMVHCMRIVPYAQTPERAGLKLWAEGRAEALLTHLENGDTSTEAICTTLSI